MYGYSYLSGKTIFKRGPIMATEFDQTIASITGELIIAIGNGGFKDAVASALLGVSKRGFDAGRAEGFKDGKKEADRLHEERRQLLAGIREALGFKTLPGVADEVQHLINAVKDQQVIADEMRTRLAKLMEGIRQDVLGIQNWPDFQGPGTFVDGVIGLLKGAINPDWKPAVNPSCQKCQGRGWYTLPNKPDDKHNCPWCNQPKPVKTYPIPEAQEAWGNKNKPLEWRYVYKVDSVRVDGPRIVEWYGIATGISSTGTVPDWLRWAALNEVELLGKGAL